MPRPVYIIAARGASEDKTTNLVTLYSVTELFEVSKVPIPEDSPEAERQLAAESIAGIRAIETVVIAVWMREETDWDAEFEHQFAILSPGIAENVADVSVFQFEKGKALFRHRMNMRGIPIPEESGIVEIESRVRRTGSPDWEFRQRYPIMCNVRIRDE